jgi:hypothetical protein
VSRQDRCRLEEAEACYAGVFAEQRGREDWLAEHADTLAYRDELSEAVAERRHELGIRAAITQPDHVVDLIGPVPTGRPEATRSWINSGGRIEGYREEWAVAPERLRQRPGDACQEQAWQVSVRTSELLARPPAPLAEQTLDHGIDFSW